MRINRFLCFLLLCGIAPCLQGQEYSYAQYDVKDGLAGSVVYHGMEDRDGFLWFATETGVSRFDGTRFRNFTVADGLPDNEILRLFVDARNRIWMMPFSSSICYYWKGKVHTPDNDTLLRKLPIEACVLSIVEDAKGNLLIADYKAFHMLNANGQVQNIHKIDGASFITGAAGLNAAGNFIIQLQMEGIYGHVNVELTAGGKVVSKRPHGYKPANIHFTHFSPGLTAHRDGDSLLVTKGIGLKRQFKFFMPPAFSNLSVFSDSLIAVNTGKGSFIYDIEKGRLLRQILKDKNIYTVFQDSEGNYWFTTAGAGIFRVGSFEFSNYTFSENGRDHLAVFSLNKIDSLLYVGTEKSLIYSIHPRQPTPVRMNKPDINMNIRISGIVKLASGRIMVGSDIGVIDYARSAKINPDQFAVKSIHLDDSNSVLISMQQGMIRVTGNNELQDLMTGKRSTCSYRLGSTYYNGTLQGLYALDSSRNITWLGEKEPLLRKRIADVEGAPDGSLWIATPEGVIRFKNGKVVRAICKNDGLTSDICRTVFIAGKDVWVGTDKGLNCIRETDGQYKITTYTRADGLIADIVNAIYVDGSQVYVGTPAGLTTFDANKISLNSYCKLHITGIQSLNHQWTGDTTAFTLAPNSNDIRFEYAGISYRSAGDITYRYRLVGLQDNWQTTQESFLSYPSLPSGTYELQLVATNKFGVQSNMLRIPFQVDKFLWEKNWFRIGALLLAWALIWVFVNARVKRVRRQNDEKLQISNRIAELEQMALKAQMNPHFIFNSLNSVQQYVIDKDIQGANKFITDFSRLIRFTLDISSSTKISVEEEISYLSTYLELEKTKFEDRFTYSVDIAPGLNTADWYIAPMILQPYVENSIRHGVRNRADQLGHINLSFAIHGQYLVCQVSDNGVGRRTAARYKSELSIEYQSKGMTLTAKRIEMLNRNQADPVHIRIEDLMEGEVAAGTRVVVEFPLSEAGKPA